MTFNLTLIIKITSIKITNLQLKIYMTLYAILYSKGHINKVFIGTSFFIFSYSRHTIFYKFQLYKVVIRHLDHMDKPSAHRTPYVVTNSIIPYAVLHIAMAVVITGYLHVLIPSPFSPIHPNPPPIWQPSVWLYLYL